MGAKEWGFGDRVLTCGSIAELARASRGERRNGVHNPSAVLHGRTHSRRQSSLDAIRFPKTDELLRVGTRPVRFGRIEFRPKILLGASRFLNRNKTPTVRTFK